MLNSKQKNKTKKTKSDADITANKRQRNYAVALNQKSKCNYFNNLDVSGRMGGGGGATSITRIEKRQTNSQ